MQSKLNNEKFQFGDNVHTLLVLFEDRKGECMDELAIENAFFFKEKISTYRRNEIVTNIEKNDKIFKVQLKLEHCVG